MRGFTLTSIASRQARTASSRRRIDSRDHWAAAVLESPARFHAESRMPAYGPPALSHQEIEELAQYLTTLRGHGDQTPQFYDTFPPPPQP